MALVLTQLAGQVNSDGTLDNAFRQQGTDAPVDVTQELSQSNDVERTDTGRYQINWADLFTFSNNPAVAVTILTTGGDGYENTATVNEYTTQEIEVAIKSNNGNWKDRSFTFFVVGYVNQ